MEGFLVVIDFQVADTHVCESKSISGVKLHCLQIAINGFLGLLLILIDISEIVVGIAVPWIYSDAFFVPYLRTI